MLVREIQEYLEKSVARKVFPGAVVGVLTQDGGTIITASGKLTYDADAPRVNFDTPYDIASLTKVFTASVLEALVERGKVRITDLLLSYFPEFSRWPKEKTPYVQELLDYGINLRLPALSSLKDLGPAEIISTILNAEPSNEEYRRVCTNATSLLTGLLAEKVSGVSLKSLLQEYFFDPLGMHHTTYIPIESFEKQNIPPTEICPWRKRIIRGEVHDESASVFWGKSADALGTTPGHAGLFSTVPDLLLFLRTVKKEKERAAQIFSNSISIQGWMPKEERWMGELCSPMTFGMTGFTGTSMICDPIRKLYIVILSNRTWPKRPVNSEAINKARRDIAHIVYKNLYFKT